MSNRVWIVCTDLTVEAGGRIDADGRGYTAANGPGLNARLAINQIELLFHIIGDLNEDYEFFSTDGTP